jgi:hypothetical protein
VGGFAVSLHGAVRATLDVDLVLPFEESYFVQAEQAFTAAGLRCRVPVTAREIARHHREYTRDRHMISWSFWSPADPLRLVDVVLTHDLREFRRTTFELQGVTVQVLALDDLIRMKRGSPREADLRDAEALEKLG